MAATQSSTRLSAYSSRLKRILPHRLFSTQSEQYRVTVLYIGGARPRTNRLLGVNERFPFAGDVSAVQAYQNLDNSAKNHGINAINRGTTSVGDLLKKTDVVKAQMRPPKWRQRLGRAESFEIAALECPRLLRKDLASLFPGEKLIDRPVSVLNVSQKSENDMSVWSPPMELERNQLTVKFVDVACDLCSWLKQQGYWADFIDPDSGRPYLGRFTNSTLFETDERYGQLGFQIEDLGCCKVIKHPKWSTRALVGTIFTDAPLDSTEIQQILDHHNV